MHQRGGELDALLVAQAELLHLVAAPLGHAEPLGPLGRPRGAASAATARAAGPGRPAARRPSSAGRGRAPRACSRCCRRVAERRAGGPAQRTSPASAASTPSTMRMVVVLPAPLLPTKPKSSPRAHVERQVAQRDHLAVRAWRPVDLQSFVHHPAVPPSSAKTVETSKRTYSDSSHLLTGVRTSARPVKVTTPWLSRRLQPGRSGPRRRSSRSAGNRARGRRSEKW